MVVKHNLLLLCVFSCALHITVGLNCTIENCDETPICPPDSELVDGRTCACVPDRCLPVPDCQYKSKPVLKLEAAGIPGDCCDVYDCVFPTELNCTGVICSVNEDDCPSDSYRLPNSQVEGECCSKPMGCACFPGPCPQPSCPNGHWFKAIRPGNGKPGSCCPLYQCLSHVSTNVSCVYNGEEIESGTNFAKSQCIGCTCEDGIIHCSTSVACPALPPDCPATRIPSGRCCPLCVFNHNEIEQPIVKPGGCKSSRGVIHENGATWQEDDCTHCTCVDGAHKCQAEMCHLTCANATYVSGECCPRCNGPSVSLPPVNCTTPENCTLKCIHGYLEDSNGCSLCKCQEQEECHLNCESGFLKDGSGNEICECAKDCPPVVDCYKKCKHGFKTNKAGCEICKCEHCRPMTHCNKKCPHGLQINQKGCQMCKCKAPEHTNKTSSVFEFECVTESGIKRDNGEAWFDNCRQCYCFDGKEMCSLVSCPKVECQNPVVSKNSCCPVCPGNDTSSGLELLCYGPGIRHEVENWKQGCLDCICHNGSVLCHSEPCPPVLCQHPLQGDCCPICPEEAQPRAVKVDPKKSCGDKLPGEVWRQSECTSCICVNGEAVCYTQACAELDTSCKTSTKLKNHCCSICFDNFPDERTCQVGNVTFNVGDEWEPHDEKCTRCSCRPGHTILCTRTICERCSKLDIPCCPKCTEADDVTWLHRSIYIVLVCLVMLGFGAGSVILFKCCQVRRHQLKICQQTAPSYHYKYVPTYEHSTPSPHKSPV